VTSQFADLLMMIFIPHQSPECKAQVKRQTDTDNSSTHKCMV